MSHGRALLALLVASALTQPAAASITVTWSGTLDEAIAATCGPLDCTFGDAFAIAPVELTRSFTFDFAVQPASRTHRVSLLTGRTLDTLSQTYADVTTFSRPLAPESLFPELAPPPLTAAAWEASPARLSVSSASVASFMQISTDAQGARFSDLDTWSLAQSRSWFYDPNGDTEAFQSLVLESVLFNHGLPLSALDRARSADDFAALLLDVYRSHAPLTVDASYGTRSLAEGFERSLTAFGTGHIVSITGLGDTVPVPEPGALALALMGCTGALRLGRSPARTAD